MILSQHNAWIHAVATLIVLGAGLFFNLAREEWCWIVIAVTSVWAAEAFNTAIEFLADATSPGFHSLIRDAKDVAAGAVLFAAAGAGVIGAIVFWPHIAKLAA